MRRFVKVPAILVSLLAGATLLAVAAASAASPLASERWNKRIVLVFAPGAAGKAKEQLDGLLADRDALKERDMLVIAVAGETVSVPFGALSAEAGAGALREAYRVAPDAPFTVVLVGKDGGEKLRRTEPVAAKAIFDLVDSMPMRQSEAGG